jgi:glycosyltransferase involved in cell wall biosynthesis
MKVSVLVPIYGVESYIAKCATSLMEQTYKDVEYIFVNDCTCDSSIERLKEVVDKYPERKTQVRIIDHKVNMGSAMARQTGIDAATGDAIVFVDSDDNVDRNLVESLAVEMHQSGADIVDGGYAIENDGNIVKRCVPLHLGEKSYLKTILCQNVEANRIWGRLIRRSLFAVNAISFHRGVDYSEDFSVLPLLLINAKRSWVDEILYYYKDDNPQSYTNNLSTKNAVSFLKAQNIVGSYLQSHPKWSDYSTAAQIGWVNVWRFARRFNVDKVLVDEHFSLRPESIIAKTLFSIMKNGKFPFGLANFLYRSTRRIYLALASR